MRTVFAANVVFTTAACYICYMGKSVFSSCGMSKDTRKTRAGCADCNSPSQSATPPLPSAPPSTPIWSRSGRVGTVIRSLPPNPEIPGLVAGWICGWPSFALKFTQLSILPRSVKWVPAYMDRFEATPWGAYICFRSAGGKLIIVKRLWASSYGKSVI